MLVLQAVRRRTGNCLSDVRIKCVRALILWMDDLMQQISIIITRYRFRFGSTWVVPTLLPGSAWKHWVTTDDLDPEYLTH